MKKILLLSVMFGSVCMNAAAMNDVVGNQENNSVQSDDLSRKLTIEEINAFGEECEKKPDEYDLSEDEGKLCEAVNELRRLAKPNNKVRRVKESEWTKEYVYTGRPKEDILRFNRIIKNLSERDVLLYILKNNKLDYLIGYIFKDSNRELFDFIGGKEKAINTIFCEVLKACKLDKESCSDGDSFDALVSNGNFKKTFANLVDLYCFDGKGKIDERYFNLVSLYDWCGFYKQLNLGNLSVAEFDLIYQGLVLGENTCKVRIDVEFTDNMLCKKIDEDGGILRSRDGFFRKKINDINSIFEYVKKLIDDKKIEHIDDAANFVLDVIFNYAFNVLKYIDFDKREEFVSSVKQEFMSAFGEKFSDTFDNYTKDYLKKYLDKNANADEVYALDNKALERGSVYSDKVSSILGLCEKLAKESGVRFDKDFAEQKIREGILPLPQYLISVRGESSDTIAEEIAQVAKEQVVVPTTPANSTVPTIDDVEKSNESVKEGAKVEVKQDTLKEMRDESFRVKVWNNVVVKPYRFVKEKIVVAYKFITAKILTFNSWVMSFFKKGELKRE